MVVHGRGGLGQLSTLYTMQGADGKRALVHINTSVTGARSASYQGARETLLRLQSFGINFVYTHNGGCEPSCHVSFTEVLRAADDVGMLVAFSQPHFSVRLGRSLSLHFPDVPFQYPARGTRLQLRFQTNLVCRHRLKCDFVELIERCAIMLALE